MRRRLALATAALAERLLANAHRLDPETIAIVEVADATPAVEAVEIPTPQWSPAPRGAA